MNKLIELLNEYDEGGSWRKLHWKGLGCEDHDTIGYKDKELSCEQDEIIAYLISKKFGFIKWLVENDKIDFDKNVLAFEFSSVYVYEGEDYENHLKEWKLLMLLSVQDEPIEFLCSILK